VSAITTLVPSATGGSSNHRDTGPAGSPGWKSSSSKPGEIQSDHGLGRRGGDRPGHNLESLEELSRVLAEPGG
jgi:hypothetical protein